MKKKGFGAVKHNPAICQEDLIKLYDVNGVALNPCTPQGLLNKCWFDVMTFLCRGSENLRQMTRDTFKINTDVTGRKFVMHVCQISVIKCRLIVKINNKRLPGACNRLPGSKLFSITTQLHCGGHLGGRTRLPDTILEEDHPMTIPSNFGSN
jgi:hypothetical protein